MSGTLNRRTLLHAATAAALASRSRPARAQTVTPVFSYPMGLPGRPLGDGFYIRRGFTCEGSTYFPGWWHTGENWHLTEGETAGVGVYAVADGEVVFTDSDYPGRVVIVRHQGDLCSMYGHLAYDPPVAAGDVVERGQEIGTVLQRTDGRASHLHFEMRTFFEQPEVNGAAPRYGYACGVDCPPGPGYWPIADPQLPVAMGWRNPMHALARRAYPDGGPAAGAEVVVAMSPASPTTVVWSSVTGQNRERVAEIDLHPGDSYPVLAIHAWAENTPHTSAEAYHVWYQIALRDGRQGWVLAMMPASEETGIDGRPSTIILNFLLNVVTPGDG
ncbi:MAG: peptidoglycan DD-metalloendopeptidase family protein [Thermomicrobiales bacterium]